jgi:hypothetical protein
MNLFRGDDMHLSDFSEAVSLKHLCGPAVDTFEGVYVGDLLSRAMSHIQAGNLWITIMNNINVVAVASLTEASAVILAENVSLTPDVFEAANEKGIAIYSSGESVYDLCVNIAKSTDDRP